MRPVVALLALAVAAQPALARPRAARPPVTVNVTMRDRAFAPALVQLPAGRLVALRLTNTDRTEHEFSATAFFAAARMKPVFLDMIHNGAVEVRSGETRTIRLIAQPGDYPLSSKKALDQASDMKGRIVVR